MFTWQLRSPWSNDSVNVTTTGKSQWLDENKVVSPKKFASFSLSLKK
jgi:hypothetical protein